MPGGPYEATWLVCIGRTRSHRKQLNTLVSKLLLMAASIQPVLLRFVPGDEIFSTFSSGPLDVLSAQLWLHQEPVKLELPSAISFFSRNPVASRLAIAKSKQDGERNLVKLYMERIETYNGYLRAVIGTPPTHLLLEAATKLDDERAQGKVRSSMHGIPILIKDNIATHPDMGMDTTAGSFALAGSRPKKSAELVERLIEAGAIILGKANLSELSYFKGEDQICGWSAVGGQSQSAYARGGIQEDDTPGGHSSPGGSSSGPAIAVSAGLAPVSIGTETAASLISPASKAALYTIKPTVNLISQQGIVLISSLADSAGPMTKSVLDLANLMDILVDPAKTSIPDGGYKSVLTNTWADLKVGVLDPAKWGSSDSWTKPDAGATKQMSEAFDSAYALIQSQAKSFHKFVPLVLPDALSIDGELAHRKLFTGHFKKDFEAYLKSLDFSHIKSLEELVQYNRDHAERELPPRYPLQDRLEKALADKSTAEELEEALLLARKVARDEGIDKILREYDLDVIIGPAESPMPTIACASGYPIASLPLGYLDFNGRPFGMAAVASGHQEAVLIKVQSAWEATFPPRQPPPYAVFAPGSAL
ncbi:amidase family [Cordyceps militaris]|uniref:Amidase family n=1 Tax=Cordyceps militaris TaxID=73501 RepID=A0A2H4S721_CORMI|nr:amidase family [Cordyceps militaris]